MDQIRLLLRLKYQLTLGLYRKRSALLVTALITAPAMATLGLGLYFAGLVSLYSLPASIAREGLSGSLTFLYIVWLVLPIMGVSLHESYDVTKLLHFPISPQRIFAANILGALFSPFSLMVFIALAAIPVGLGGSLGGGMVLGGLVILFVFHIVSLSQALLTMLWGLFRSRRVRDFWLVAASLFSLLFFMLYQVVLRRFSASTLGYALTLQPSRIARYLPSGWVADASLAWHQGDMAGFGWRAALLAAVCAATVSLAGVLVMRIYAGEIALDGWGQRKGRRAPGGRSLQRLPGWIPASVAAMALKEWRTILRDPAVKVELMRTVGWMLAWPVIMLSSPQSDIGPEIARYAGPAVLGMGMMVLLTSTLSASGNVLARDGTGLSLLFTLPAPRFSFLLGKNAALFLAMLPVNVVLSVAASIVAGNALVLLPALVVNQGLVLMTLSVGNLYSVYAPRPMPQKGQNPFSTSTGPGCLVLLVSSAVFPVFLVCAAPVALALLAPMVWIHPAWFLMTVPLAVLYAVGFYTALTHWAARRLERREPEILATILSLPS